MKTLPNGVTVFNATPHPIRFWMPGWSRPVEVETDTVINARIQEQVVRDCGEFTLVSTIFLPEAPNWALEGQGDGEDEEEVTEILAGWGIDHLVEEAREAGADVIVGSIIAAQAYPGLVVAMCPCDGFERVPPDQKRMRADKFTIF